MAHLCGMAIHRLTGKQKIFISEYLKDKNATRAAKAAGYPPKTAKEMGAENLSKPHIKNEIDQKLQKLQDKLEISAERTLKRIADIAYHAKKARNSDILKACELLGKHFKMFTDVSEISGKDGGPQVIFHTFANGSEAEIK